MRTYRWLEWRACERFGILPEQIQPRFEDCSPWMQASLIGYEEVRARDGD